MNKKHARARFRRPVEGFKAGVYRKGNLTYFRAVVIYLQSVQGRIRLIKLIYT
jgi:hypothetical protein